MPAHISHQSSAAVFPGYARVRGGSETGGLVEQVTVLGTGPDYVRINARDTQHCGQCAMKSGCGHQLLSEAIFHNKHDKNDQTLQLPLTPGLQGQVHTGDILDLVIDEYRLMSLSCLQYVVPVLCMLLGTAVASGLATAIGTGEGWVIAAALGAMGVGLGVVRMIASGMPLPTDLAIHSADSAGDSATRS